MCEADTCSANQSNASQQTAISSEMGKCQLIGNQTSEKFQVFCWDYWETRSSLSGVLQAGRTVHKPGPAGAILSCYYEGESCRRLERIQRKAGMKSEQNKTVLNITFEPLDTVTPKSKSTFHLSH